MYPIILPQGVVYPAISYNQVSGVRDWTLCGPIDLARIRVQINLWSKSYDQAHDLADAVRQKMQSVQIEIGVDSPSIRVGFIKLDNEFDDPFQAEAGLIGVYRVVQDYIVSHQED
jgi:hypothetical protein